MNAWLNANYIFIGAMFAGFAIRWAANQFLANATKGGGRGGVPGAGRDDSGRAKAKKWDKSRVIKFVTLFFMFAAGLLTAFGAYPLAQWLVGWGAGLAGWLSIGFSVLTLAAGWHSLHGLIGLVHDMSDGTPDDEAFSAAFWVPTTIPLGWAALAGLFTNPRGVGTGLGVVAVSLVTAVYAHKILKKTHAVRGHYKAWMWLSTIICAFVGVVHIAALAYLNQITGDWLPDWATWLLRGGLVVAGIVFAVVGLGDLFRDWTPEKWSQWAAMYTIPVFTVLAVSVATLQSNATTSLRTVFGAFS